MPNSGKKKSRGCIHRAAFTLVLVVPILTILTGCNSANAENTSSTAIPAAESPNASQAPAVAVTTAAPADIPSLVPSEMATAVIETTVTEPAASPTVPPPVESQVPSAATLPDPNGYEWQVVASGLQSPIGFADAGDGSGRLFVIEQVGQIQLVKDGQISPEPFLDIRGRVGSSASEQGLLGLAFHPNYQENGRFFVNYTNQGGDTVIAEYRVSPDNPDRADPDSEKSLLFVPQPYANHNGGVLAFGPDGYLYIGLGDGGSGGDPLGNGQSTETLLGKILRIDVDNGDPYAIPPGNPFEGGGGAPEIWAIGLRNPWRFSFDQLTGDLYIGDVGQGTWEEVDYQPASSVGGENYGWNILEGSVCFQRENCDQTGLTMPVHTYQTHVAGTCSVTGGYVYRGQSLPEWNGVYLFGDYCSGEVWGLLRSPDGTWQHASLFQTGVNIASFGQDEAGEVYLVDMGGNVFRLNRR